MFVLFVQLQDPPEEAAGLGRALKSPTVALSPLHKGVSVQPTGPSLLLLLHIPRRLEKGAQDEQKLRVRLQCDESALKGSGGGGWGGK